MSTNQSLTAMVEQAAAVLGVGRSTGYELVRSGDLKRLRLRRCVVASVAPPFTPRCDPNTVSDVLSVEPRHY